MLLRLHYPVPIAYNVRVSGPQEDMTVDSLWMLAAGCWALSLALALSVVGVVGIVVGTEKWIEAVRKKRRSHCVHDGCGGSFARLRAMKSDLRLDVGQDIFLIFLHEIGEVVIGEEVDGGDTNTINGLYYHSTPGACVMLDSASRYLASLFAVRKFKVIVYLVNWPLS
jgi:hypothetical protein